MRGIIFKPWKIKAIAESPPDREWQTRRLIKPQPHWIDYIDDKWWSNRGTPASDYIKPRYQVGETVYIKEAFTYVTLAGKGTWKDKAIKDGSFRCKPDGSPVTMCYKLDGYEIGSDWLNPRTMPAWAARYHIRITAVRAERLQEITEEDCVAEGIYPNSIHGDCAFHWSSKDSGFETTKTAYHVLWDSINKTHPWSDNDYVWVYTFKRVEVRDGN